MYILIIPFNPHIDPSSRRQLDRNRCVRGLLGEALGRDRRERGQEKAERAFRPPAGLTPVKGCGERKGGKELLPATVQF